MTRRERQFLALNAIITQNNFDLICMVLKVSTTSNYLKYSLPDLYKDLEFIVKGSIRCEMLDDEEGKQYRRLFGTTKEGHWKDKDLNYFKRVEIGEQLCDHTLQGDITLDQIPRAWKSRVSFKAFDEFEVLQNWIEGCPLARWTNTRTCPLTLNDNDNDGQFLLLQIMDVDLPDGNTFSDFLRNFFNSDRSSLLQYIGHCSCINFMREDT